MNSGMLRKQIIIKRPFKSYTWGSAERFVTWATVWGQIKQSGGSKQRSADKNQSFGSQEVVIRYIPGLLPSMRLYFNDKTYRIESIVNTLEKNFELVLEVTEVVNRG